MNYVADIVFFVGLMIGIPILIYMAVFSLAPKKTLKDEALLAFFRPLLFVIPFEMYRRTEDPLVSVKLVFLFIVVFSIYSIYEGLILWKKCRNANHANT
jgi:hypothetical protein